MSEEETKTTPQETTTQQEAPGAQAQEEMPMPPATFDFLVFSMRTQAEVALGLLHFGDEKEKPEVDLRSARHLIDVLAMLAEKTKGNLSIEEQRLLENSLTELRFRYVQVVDESKRK